MNINDQFQNSSLQTLVIVQLYDILARSSLLVNSAKTQGNIPLPSVYMTIDFGA